MAPKNPLMLWTNCFIGWCGKECSSGHQNTLGSLSEFASVCIGLQTYFGLLVQMPYQRTGSRLPVTNAIDGVVFTDGMSADSC